MVAPKLSGKFNSLPYLTNAWIVVNNDISERIERGQDVQGASPRLVKLFLSRQDLSISARLFPPAISKTLYNCYIRSEGLHDLIELRDQMMEMEMYDEGVRCVGWWEYCSGEPLGGVGSPWFQTHPHFYREFPSSEYPTTTSCGTAQISPDRVLVAGQARRKFV